MENTDGRAVTPRKRPRTIRIAESLGTLRPPGSAGCLGTRRPPETERPLSTAALQTQGESRDKSSNSLGVKSKPKMFSVKPSAEQTLSLEAVSAASDCTGAVALLKVLHTLSAAWPRATRCCRVMNPAAGRLQNEHSKIQLWGPSYFPKC